jgi:polyisoprenoid-binding protein YceI
MSSQIKVFWSVGLATLALLGLAQSGAAQTFQIDPVHSYVNFRVKHMNAGYSYGRFNQFSGSFVIDEKNLARSSVQFEIDAASVDTNNQKRDDHLRSPDFFNVRQFPKITFKSTSVRKINNTTAEIKGNLTLRGVTKPITSTVVLTGRAKNQRGSTVAGFEITFALKRSDFGMSFMQNMLGDEVRVTVSVEGVQR